MLRLTLLAVLCTLSLPVAAQVLPTENLETSGIPAIPDRIVERTHQYQEVRSANFAGWDRSGDGMFIRTRFGNTVQVHRVDGPGAARRQLTFFEEPVGSVSVDPREGRNGFAFTRDVGGGEFYQVFYFDIGSGSTTLLTDGKSRNSGALWSESGDRFAFSSTRRNGTDTDIWLMDAQRPEQARLLVGDGGYWYPAEWSPAGDKLIVGRYVSANESYPYIVDVASGEKIALSVDATRKISYGGAEWSPDGGTIYYSSDEQGEFKHLFVYDVASGERRNLSPELQWDLGGFRLSHDGSYLAFTVNENGADKLHLYRMPAMEAVPLNDIPLGLISGLSFNPDDSKLALGINAASSPGDVYTLDLEQLDLTRWTYSEVGGLDTDTFSEPTLISYPTFDEVDGGRRQIPAIMYMPKHAGGKVPVIISIHGGPEGQSRPYFSSGYQYWVNELGCALILPNVRGSTGYGKTYLALDNWYNREHSVQDIGALLDWIATQPGLDADRVAVFGGSYGGYMVLASLVEYGERLRCGVDVVGISNFVTFLENTERYRRDYRRVEYGDERDPDMRAFLEKISPTSNAEKLRSPLFVAQGENDPRVPASEARQIAAAVQANGVDVWTLFASDEGHGFRKKGNRDYFTWATILFFETYLLK